MGVEIEQERGLAQAAKSDSRGLRKRVDFIKRILSSFANEPVHDVNGDRRTIGDVMYETETALPQMVERAHDLIRCGVEPLTDETFAVFWGRLLTLEAEAKVLRERARNATYRFPTVLGAINRVVGGKRQGGDHGFPAKHDTERGGVVVVRAPKGFQLELGCATHLSSNPADYDEGGKLRPDALLRLVRGVLGPSVSRMGHVAFALAFRHAAERGEKPDGRFMFSPSEVADLLGYTREYHSVRKDDGTERPRRISKDVVKIIRSDFKNYADLQLSSVTLSAGKNPARRDERMTILYCTDREVTERRPGQRGRDKRVEWRIRDDVWKWAQKSFVHIPFSLLRCHDDGADPQDTTRPAEWARCLRVYEVLACHARINSRLAADGGFTLSYEVLIREANVSADWARPAAEREQYLVDLRRLATRRAIVFEEATLADGREGIRFSLAPERMAELVHVRGQRVARLNNREVVQQTGRGRIGRSSSKVVPE